MSWWDTSQFTNLASAALKTAQKRIDKVLDIQEDGDPLQSSASFAGATSLAKKSTKAKTEQTEDALLSSSAKTEEEAWSLLAPSKKTAPKELSKHKLDRSMSDVSGPEDKKERPLASESYDSLPSVTTNTADIAISSETNISIPEPKGEPVKPTWLSSSSVDVVFEGMKESAKKRGPLKLGSKLAKKREKKQSTDAEVEQAVSSNDEPLLSAQVPIEDTSSVEQKIDTMLSTELKPVIACDTISNIPKVEEYSVLEESTAEVIKPASQPYDEDSNQTGAIGDVEVEDNVDDPRQTAWGDDISLSILAESQISTSTPIAEGDESLDATSEEPSHVTSVESSQPRDSETTEDTDTPCKPSADEQEVEDSSKRDDNRECPTGEDTSSVAPECSDPISTSTEIVTDSIIAEAREHAPITDCEVAVPMNVTQELHIDTASPADSVSSDVLPAKSELDWTKSSAELDESSDAIDDLSESNKTLTSSESNRTLEGDAAVTDSPEKQDSPSKSEQTVLSSSSYVKNMLEEAMTESMKDNDSHTDSHSSSDMVRVESGHTSGHTSADEIDTTTSSDIEIISHISTPTPNGDYGPVNRPFDLSPLRHALSRSVRRGSPPGHKRSDSGSSGTSYRSHGGDDLISPDSSHSGGSGKGDVDISEHDRGTEGASKDDEQTRSNPLETEKLLKIAPKVQLPPITESSESCTSELVKLRELNLSNQEWFKKLAEMAEVLDAREKKLVELSRDNIDLVETNSILRNQLQHSEDAREAEQTDLNKLTEEFTVRISDAEKKINQVLKEKEGLKKSLVQAEAEIIRKSDNTATQRLIAEKDQQITELLEEGEKLSKQQLQSNNIIKKLRVKEKENEGLSKSNTKKIETQKEEIEKLKAVLDNKIENEKKQKELIHQLEAAVKHQEADLSKLKSEAEDFQERNRSLQVALDNSYKEIAELHKAKAAQASETQSIALSAEMQAKEELRIALERFQLQARNDQESLINQIEDLQLSISRMEKEHGRKEDVLRQEISDLQQRLQEAEERNQELTSSVSGATRPLLRQIENIQSTYAAQSATYERVEKNLTERLSEAQSQLAAAVEKERAASETMLDVTTRISSLESQVSALRQDKSRLQAQLEMERAKAGLLEEAKNSESAQLEALKRSHDHDISDLRKDKVMLENQLEMEKLRVESEKKKVVLAHEQLKDKELQLAHIESRAVTPPILSGQVSLQSSFVDSPMTMSAMSLSGMSVSQTDESLEKSLMISSANGSKVSLYDSLRHSGAASVMENLQSQLKRREGEIALLQSEISELERTREAMARELVDLTGKNEELEEKLRGYPELTKSYKELDGRYNAILQMYGEKVEEADELRLDLQDVKDMYKSQIDHLLKGMGH